MYPNLNNKLANGEDKRTADAPIQFDRPCDSCKHRKIKCDNLLPCFQCISRGLQCQYTAQPSKRKRKRSAVANLLLESDLEHQKKFAANTKQEYEGNDPKEDIEEHPIVPVATTTCSMGKQFCSNVIQVMQATAAAFYRLMKPIMPYTTEEYSSEISVLLYHRIFTTKIPDEIISGSSIVNFETQQQLLTHSTIFAIGSKLIHLNVKALHFHNAAMTILHLPAIRNRMLLESETAKQLVLSLIYSIVYLILQKNYEAIAPLWHKASDVFRTNEKNFDQQTIEELTYALIILAPIESSRNNDFWIHKLDSFQTGHNNLELSLFKEVARILAFLSRLGKLVSHEDARSLCYLWRYATEAEKILARFYGSVQYAFYGSLIFGLKAIAAINMPNNMEDEIDRCTKYVEQFYACIVDPVQQMWLKSQFEYLQFVFNKLQQETELLNTYDLSIAAIESLMDVINAVPIRSVQTNFE